MSRAAKLLSCLLVIAMLTAPFGALGEALPGADNELDIISIAMEDEALDAGRAAVSAGDIIVEGVPAGDIAAEAADAPVAELDGIELDAPDDPTPEPVGDVAVAYTGAPLSRPYDGTADFALDIADFQLEGSAAGLILRAVAAEADSADAGSRTVIATVTVGSDALGWREVPVVLEAEITPVALGDIPRFAGQLEQAQSNGGPADEPLVYTGLPVCPDDWALYNGDTRLVQGVDYTLAYANNINTGTAVVTISGAGNYSGSCTASFEILPAGIDQPEIIAGLDELRDGEYAWTGEPVLPAFTLTYNGVALVEGRDYSVSCADNTEPGEATVTITGEGNFTGVCNAAYIISNKPAVYLTPAALTLGVGQTAALNVSDSKAQFASSNKKIAAVNASGVVKGVKKGKATIGMRASDGTVLTSAVTVKAAPKKVALSSKKLTLGVGQSKTLTAKLSPSGSYSPIAWSSSNSAVAAVVDGVVTPLKPGKATITAKTYNKKTAKCVVTVVPAPDAVALNYGAINLCVKGTATLKPALSPKGAATAFKYMSSDASVASVNSKGKITALKLGTATITVATANGKTASCLVRVLKAPSRVALDRTSATLAVGMKLTLTPAVADADANPNVSWATSKKKVATVSGGVVTAKKAGTATITVKTVNGKKATCKITVKAKPKSISVKAAKTALTVGETTKAAVTLTKNSYSPIEWSVDGSAVTVDQSGNITAVAAGTATVIARATAANLSARCAITVKAAPGATTPEPSGKQIIDISKWQGSIDFDALKPYAALVICRAANSTAVDSMFYTYAKAMNARGIPFGVYCYSHAADAASARAEAQALYKIAAPYKPKFYVIDAEEASITQAALVAFVSELRGLGVKKVGAYVGHHRYTQYGFSAIKGKYDFVWIPRYGSNDGTVAGAVKPAYPCDLWQYSSFGQIPGIKGRVDVSIVTGQGKSLSWFTS